MEKEADIYEIYSRYFRNDTGNTDSTHISSISRSNTYRWLYRHNTRNCVAIDIGSISNNFTGGDYQKDQIHVVMKRTVVSFSFWSRIKQLLLWKGVIMMILFAILLITLIIVITTIVLVIATGGAVFLVLFGDLIVFILIMIGIIKLFGRNKNKRR